jgi:outer membrane protein OmpA-like peptidoglycan-associated protein/tetratricopeptide (TPR) repeat protein
MKAIWKKVLLGFLCCLGYGISWAQTDSLLQQADRLLSWKAYGRAIEIYTQVLTKPESQLSVGQRGTAQEQLAYAYQQVGDTKKAQQYYQLALDGNKDRNPQLLLRYAQVLAGNGRFQESQQYYEQYLKSKPSSFRPLPGPAGVAAAGENKSENVTYKLDYLDFNTTGEEFSPAFYQKGLVYVGGTRGSASVTPNSKSNYLDLYYIPDRSQIKAKGQIMPDGSAKRIVLESASKGWQLGADEYTRPTPNDFRTVMGYDVGINVSNGLGYGVRPTNPAKRFSESLNSKYHEGPVTFSSDGSRIYFTRTNYANGLVKLGKNQENASKLKLYTAVQQDGAWTSIEELPFNNNDYSVGHPSLSRDDKLLYFVSDMPGGRGGTDIYVTRYENGKWGKPMNMGEPINTPGDELFPFVDGSGNLYFSSNGHHGMGGLDIFYVALTNGKAEQVVDHLDAPINSPMDDFGLITDINRRSGFLSSNRRNKTDDDIYRFVRESSLYSCRDLTMRLYDNETNMPLDSVMILIKAQSEGGSEQSLVTDITGLVQFCLESNNDFTVEASKDGFITGKVGFSTRFLTDDQPSRLEMAMARPTVLIDTVETAVSKTYAASPSALSKIGGVVVSELNRQPLEGVTVRLRNECDQTQQEYVTKADGRYAFEVAEGCDYTLTASKPSYGTNTSRVKRLPTKSVPKEIDADLKMFSVGDVVTVDNIYYDLDQYSLRANAKRELNRIVAAMRRYPSLVIEVRSHTDSRGDAAHNKMLSIQRANEVANFITSQGISRKRMRAIGMGESQPINNCVDGVICTEAEHQRNRRTEFKVIEIK